MRQFNLEEYLKNPNQKIVTRNGRDATIMYTNKKDIDGYSIVALVHEDNFDNCVTYLPDGAYLPSRHSDNDLFFAPEKKEGWVNIYTDDCGVAYSGQIIYGVYEDAETAGLSLEGYLSTAKIEWEE